MLILVLVAAVLAVARVTRLLYEDRLTITWRQWVIKKTNPDSLAAYFVHCPWCMSMWVAPPIMTIAVLWPNKWVLLALSIPAASYLTGFLAAREVPK